MSGSASAAAPDPSDAANAQRRQSGTSSDAQAAPAPPVQGDRAAPPPPPGDRAAAPSSHARADPHADFLITSEERDAAEARLRQAVADDVLTLDEFGDRMRLLLSAKTRGDLREAVAGLPMAAEPLRRTRERGKARPAREQQHIIAVLSEEKTHGRWRPAPKTTALAIMGSAVVDLQGAEFEDDELTINAVAFMGGVEIIVPEGVEVELSGFSVLGDRTVKVEGPVLVDAPLVRVDAYAVMGGVEVRHPKRKELRAADDDRGAFADRVPIRAARDERVDARQPRKASSIRAAVRRWTVGLLAAAALALPLGWTLASDDVVPAVFGSNEHVVATQSLSAGDEVTVGAPVAFGSVAIQVPEGVNVERDGLVIFGSTECPACAAQFDPDAPTVHVRTIGGFGSVEIIRAGAPGADLD